MKPDIAVNVCSRPLGRVGPVPGRCRSCRGVLARCFGLWCSLSQAMARSALLFALAIVALWLGGAERAWAERIKDVAQVAGVRPNQLVGYGLVVGLNGTGDSTGQGSFTAESLKSLLTQYGINLPVGANPQSKNIAAVMVQGELTAFAKPGQRMDVTVSSLGNAKSLRGGTLVMTPLRGADGQIYAMAQGSLTVSGFGAEANDGSRVTVNIPSSGRIPGGATVERAVPTPLHDGDFVYLNLNQPDFSTAQRTVEVLNRTLGPGAATAMDAATIRVGAPLDRGQRVGFVAFVENLEVEPAQAAAKVIVNSRTGTVVIGSNVRLSPAAVAHGNLVVTIQQPVAGTDFVPGQAGQADVREESARAFVFESGASLQALVDAINRIGTAPGDLVAILEALKQAGSLSAELIVI